MCVSVMILNPIVLKSFMNLFLKLLSKTLSRFMVLYCENIRANSKYTEFRFALELYRRPQSRILISTLQKNLLSLMISRPLFSQDNANLAKERSASEISFNFARRFFFAFLPFSDKKLLLTREMVLQTELNPQVERRDKRRNAHRPWHLAQPLWIKYFVSVPLLRRTT